MGWTNIRIFLLSSLPIHLQAARHDSYFPTPQRESDPQKRWRCQFFNGVTMTCWLFLRTKKPCERSFVNNWWNIVDRWALHSLWCSLILLMFHLTLLHTSLLTDGGHYFCLIGGCCLSRSGVSPPPPPSPWPSHRLVKTVLIVEREEFLDLGQTQTDHCLQTSHHQ